MKYPRIRIDQSATEQMQATARRLARSPENRKKTLHEVLRGNVLDENGLWESEAARTRYYTPKARDAEGTRRTGGCGTGMGTGWCANERRADTGQEEQPPVEGFNSEKGKRHGTNDK